ncbi:MAG TPA: Ig-like domain-containing protein, partial [Acidimicrobiales bacterium]|nr:Ig-like domain-containing protein [Acidimicrobiales bacterium]
MGTLLVATIGALAAPAPIASAYTTQSPAISGISCSADNLTSAWGSVTVPTNAVTATFVLTGGGGAGGDNNGGNGGTGGGGGIVTGTINVTPGQVVWARVGCGAPDAAGNADGYTKGGSGGPLGGGGGGSTAVCVNSGTASCGSGTVHGIAGGGGGGGRGFDGSFPCNDETGGSGGTANTGGSASGGQQGGTGFGGARGSNGGGGTNGGGGGGGTGQGPGQATGTNTPNNTGGSGGSADSGTAPSGGNATSVAPTGSGGTGGNGTGSDSIISGGGGGGYTGGGAGGPGDDGSACDNESASGAGAGSSWVSGSVSSVAWSNAAANAANCTSSNIGTTPGGGGNRGVGGCDGNATISFKINTLPTGTNQSINVTKGVGQAITLVASDTAGEGTPTCANVSGLAQGKGTLTGSGCSYTYTASANTSGSDSFTYQVKDADNALSATSYTITLNIQNAAPTGAGQSGLTAIKGVGLVIALANADTDGDSRTCSVVTGPGKGGVVLSGGTPSTGCTATYTASLNTTGPDSFTYRVTDSIGLASATTYTVALNVANQAPTSAAQTVTVAPGSVTGLTLGGSDPDGDATTCASSTPSGGSLSSGSSCTPSYTAPNTLGTYTFSYTRSDGVLSSSSATVTINVQSPDVAVTKSHVGVFNDGTQGVYTIGVSNVGN